MRRPGVRLCDVDPDHRLVAFALYAAVVAPGRGSRSQDPSSTPGLRRRSRSRPRRRRSRGPGSRAGWSARSCCSRACSRRRSGRGSSAGSFTPRFSSCSSGTCATSRSRCGRRSPSFRESRRTQGSRWSRARGLWARRFLVDRVRYISAPSDHLMLALLVAIGASGWRCASASTPTSSPSRRSRWASCVSTGSRSRPTGCCSCTSCSSPR